VIADKMVDGVLAPQLDTKIKERRMSHKSILAFVSVAALGFATVLPATGSALGPGLGGRSIAGSFGGGNAGPSNAGRPIIPLASQNHLSSFVGSRTQIRCRIVQVGNPRANPPMLVCP
jgi:hypothetical protein